jgi:chorismate lyase/3-hydroxybenzoate synthase
MRAPTGLHLEYVSPAEYRAAGWGDVLGVAAFNGAHARAAAREGEPPATAGQVSDMPLARVSTPVLPTAIHVYEVWRAGEPTASGRHQRVSFRRTGDMLFGCIAVDEAEFQAPGHTPLHEATAQVYREICATLDAEDCPYLVRVWNYLPDINRDSQGTERYRQFNSARQHALRASGRALSGNVPAASALGAASASPLVVYFLAGRQAPVFVENPRQVSAYHYPRQYGRHSPVFSRAALLRQPESLTLFISGTASIVGHRSLHAGDTAAQTRETLANIEALLAEANRISGGSHFALDTLACKVYVRRPSDLPVIQAELKRGFGANARILYLQADICRQDLLVEIEATAMSSLASEARTS